MTPQQLRNSILQLAIEGKLVEQRSEEGTAEELYQLIQKEKEGLIKAGQIKKQKILLPIQEDEVPFDIPATWEWVRVGDLVELNPKNDLEDDVEVGFIPMACIMDGYKNKHSQETRYWKEIKKGFTHFADNDIAIAKITPCFQNRKSVIFKNLKNGFGAGTTEISVIRVINNLLINEYLLWFFKSEYFIFNGVKSFTGTAGQQRIHKDYLSQCLIPIPPIMEQKRIVQKIEAIFPIIDRYENAWHKLDELNKKFPEELQKSILQAAIQGKLSSPKLEDGSGKDVHIKILNEKSRLITEGKIKKEKELNKITEVEIPFDIPKNWIWSRFGDLGSYRKGPFGSALTKNLFVPKSDDTVKVYEQKNAIKKDATLGEYYITKEYYEEKMLAFTVIPGDIIVSCAGTIGETFILPEDSERGIINQALMRMRLFKPIYTKYFLLYFDFILKQNVRKNSKGSAIKNIPPFSILKNYLVPLPPVAEQKRIVETVHQFLLLLEQYKSGIE
jgi:hypothetical protein